MRTHLTSLSLGVVVGLALLFASLHLVATAQAADADTPADAVFPHGLPWAYGEDTCFSRRCVWDARHQGNGEGQSMILTRYDGGYIAKPISHRRAHRLQVAWCDRPKVTCDGYED